MPTNSFHFFGSTPATKLGWELTSSSSAHLPPHLRRMPAPHPHLPQTSTPLPLSCKPTFITHFPAPRREWITRSRSAKCPPPLFQGQTQHPRASPSASGPLTLHHCWSCAPMPLALRCRFGDQHCWLTRGWAARPRARTAGWRATSPLTPRDRCYLGGW